MIPPAPTSVTNCGVLACVAFLGVVVGQSKIALVILPFYSSTAQFRGYEKHLIPDCEVILSPSTLVLFL